MKCVIEALKIITFYYARYSTKFVHGEGAQCMFGVRLFYVSVHGKLSQIQCAILNFCGYLFKGANDVVAYC